MEQAYKLRAKNRLCPDFRTRSPGCRMISGFRILFKRLCCRKAANIRHPAPPWRQGALTLFKPRVHGAAGGFFMRVCVGGGAWATIALPTAALLLVPAHGTIPASEAEMAMSGLFRTIVIVPALAFSCCATRADIIKRHTDPLQRERQLAAGERFKKTSPPYPVLGIAINNRAGLDPAISKIVRAMLAAAKKRDLKGLTKYAARHVEIHAHGIEINPKLSGAQNLAEILITNGSPDETWPQVVEILQTILKRASATRLRKKRDTLCTPSMTIATGPTTAQKLLQQINGEKDENKRWQFAGATPVAVRAAPDKNASIIASLKNRTIQIMSFREPGDKYSWYHVNSWLEGHDHDWQIVVLPDGRTGYVTEGLRDFSQSSRLCFTKSGKRWRITAFYEFGIIGSLER
jgi:hypothetical protein